MSTQFMDDVTRFFRVRKTIFQMLKHRGYFVSDAKLNEKKEDFKEMWEQAASEGHGREKFIILVHKNSRSSPPLDVKEVDNGMELTYPHDYKTLDARVFIDGLSEEISKLGATQEQLDAIKWEFREGSTIATAICPQNVKALLKKMPLKDIRVAEQEQQLIVFFPQEKTRVTVKHIRDLAVRMDEKGIREAILVASQPLTPLARTAIGEARPKMRIEVFHENELIINITQHELVPEHKPLTDEEKLQLLNRYKMKPSQLPRMQQTDPVARYFGMQRDQVMKIIRSSETAGRYVTYRLVV